MHRMTPFFVAGSILATMSMPMLVRAMTLRRVSHGSDGGGCLPAGVNVSDDGRDGLLPEPGDEGTDGFGGDALPSPGSPDHPGELGCRLFADASASERSDVAARGPLTAVSLVCLVASEPVACRSGS